jgi:hypothetical protein
VPFSESVQEKGLAGEALDLTLPGVADVASFVLRTFCEEGRSG